MAGTRREYIARERMFGDLKFDFIIADENAKQWYDGAPSQFMPEREWCRQHIQPGDIVVDGGAHHGMMSLLFAFWSGPSGRVVAFEPIDSAADVIRRNAALNGLEGRIEVHAKALGASDSSASYVENGGTAIMGEHSGYAPATVQTVRLDAAMAGRKAAFLKLDVEGYETPTLTGARRTLESARAIDLELHCMYARDRVTYMEDIVALLPRGFGWAVQPTPYDTPRPVLPDAATLARYDNPHLFGYRL